MTRVRLTLAYVNINWSIRGQTQPPRPSQGRIAEPPAMPLGVLYLAAACQQVGYSCDLKVVHMSESDVSAAALTDSLMDENQVLGVSCMSSSLPMVLLAAERIKRRFPEKVIVLGGAGTAFIEREVLKAFSQIDAIVSGEGEETLVELLEALSSGPGLGGIRGLHFRAGDGSIVSNPPRPLVPDLDTIPFPAVELLPRPYRPTSISVITSRGCPYKCTFCQASRIWCNKSRLRQPEACLREIEHDLAVLGEMTHVTFIDDLFTFSRARVRRFCELLQEESPVAEWSCLGRVRVLDEKLLATMREAGCQTVGFGIESGSNDVLRRLNKGFTIEEAIEAVAMASRHIPRIRVFFMWGFPFESYQDFALTLMAQQKIWEIASRAGVMFDMGMFILNPLPGTAIAQEYHQLTPVPLEGDCGGLWSLGGERFDAEVRDLILKHPSLFPIFYAVQHPELERKRNAISQMWDRVRHETSSSPATGASQTDWSAR